MSYREFTIQDVKHKLGLHLEEDESLYDGVEDVPASPALVAWLAGEPRRWRSGSTPRRPARS